MKFFMLINLKLLSMPNSFLLNIAEHENFSANKYENAPAADLSKKTSFITSGPVALIFFLVEHNSMNRNCAPLFTLYDHQQ